jgi:phage replication-related protein YjqB (UPF0714/DUF867 family)
MVSGRPYGSFARLKRHEREGIDFSRLVIDRDSSLLILAPHGGGIEPGTSEIACALAGDEFSLFTFDALREEGCERLHLASTSYDEPQSASLLEKVEIAVAIHGCAGRKEVVYAGGLYQELKTATIQALQEAGFTAVEDTTWHAGLHSRNICNRGRLGKGLQLEISNGLRKRMFADLTRPGRLITYPPFDEFRVAVRKILFRFT